MATKPKPTLRLVTFPSSSPEPPEPIRRVGQPGPAEIPRPVLYRKELKPTTRLVAAWLYDHCAPGTSTATGWTETIADDLGLSQNTVKAAIKELRQYRVIMTVNQAVNHRGVTYNQYNLRRYDPAKPKAVKPPRPKAAKPSAGAPPKPGGHIPKQPPKPKSPPLPAASNWCNTCRGTKWAYDKARNSSRRCPDCSKP